MDGVMMKLKFFIQLAELDPVSIERGQEDQLLSMARDGDILRVLKDDLLKLEAEGDPAQKS